VREDDTNFLCNKHDQQIGELIATVKILAEKVDKLTGELDEVNKRMNTGKGVLIGMLSMAAMLGYSASDMIKNLFGQ